MSDITIHTGSLGDETTIHVDWTDHNTIRHQTNIDVEISKHDKPRTLEIRIDHCPVFRSKAGATTFL